MPPAAGACPGTGRRDALPGAIDIALIAHGSLPDPAQCERLAATVQALAANGGGTIALMNALAGQLEDQGMAPWR